MCCCPLLSFPAGCPFHMEMAHCPSFAHRSSHSLISVLRRLCLSCSHFLSASAQVQLPGAGLVTNCVQLLRPMDCSLQAPLSMGFSRQEYWSGLPFPSPGDVPDTGIKPRSPALQADSLLTELRGKSKRGLFNPLLHHFFTLLYCLPSTFLL